MSTGNSESEMNILRQISAAATRAFGEKRSGVEPYIVR